jgi:thymidine phosphorylase
MTMATKALDGGDALATFGRMVEALGGPSDFVANWRTHLPAAPVIRAIPAPRTGYISAYATRDIGLAVIGLGGGRTRPQDAIDHRTGFSAIVPKGSLVTAGETIAVVHAADEASAQAAAKAYLAATEISDGRPAPAPVILKLVS